ncbi:hypothetical protein LS70_007950 [Helicobacter sp. MIT 11-5569]|uniref:Cj0814 family flagellar-dependent secreted protein n=1 Tax=Helicobacter sp. MIT 11-5569 TaxID=1548151 RepID=UPI00051FD94C|nr:hypothetical protein [Helicobacter sp. MIT 11-5569]TLD81217.1 hypothetical protein LS70_007950 [Helicobacter sp. MIT 11-5569]
MDALSVGKNFKNISTMYAKTESNKAFQANMDLPSIDSPKSLKLAQSPFVSSERLATTHLISNLIQSYPNTPQIQSPKASVLTQLLGDSTFINTAKTSETQQEISTERFYGYGVDEKGYMLEDFNAAAGLPSDFKLHKSTLETIIDHGQSIWHNRSNFYGLNIAKEEVFKEIDIANTIKQYYDTFTQIIPEMKSTYSSKEVTSLPKGFSDMRFIGNAKYEDNDLLKADAVMISFEGFKVTNLYNTTEKYREAKIVESLTSSVGINGFHVHTLDFSPSALANLPFYQSDGDSFSQEALFVSFLNAQDAEILGGGNTQLNQKLQNTRQERFARARADEVSLVKRKPYLSSDACKAALENPERFKRLVELQVQESSHLLGRDLRFTPNEIAANFGGVIMDLYAFTQLGFYPSSLDSRAKSIDFTMKFTEAVHNNWKPSQQDINNYAQNLYKKIQNFLP